MPASEDSATPQPEIILVEGLDAHPRHWSDRVAYELMMRLSNRIKIRTWKLADQSWQRLTDFLLAGPPAQVILLLSPGEDIFSEGRGLHAWYFLDHLAELSATRHVRVLWLPLGPDLGAIPMRWSWHFGLLWDPARPILSLSRVEQAAAWNHVADQILSLWRGHELAIRWPSRLEEPKHVYGLHEREWRPSASIPRSHARPPSFSQRRIGFPWLMSVFMIGVGVFIGFVVRGMIRSSRSSAQPVPLMRSDAGKPMDGGQGDGLR
jgi:hypothetical protein